MVLIFHIAQILGPPVIVTSIHLLLYFCETLRMSPRPYFPRLSLSLRTTSPPAYCTLSNQTYYTWIGITYDTPNRLNLSHCISVCRLQQAKEDNRHTYTQETQTTSRHPASTEAHHHEHHLKNSSIIQLITNECTYAKKTEARQNTV